MTVGLLAVLVLFPAIPLTGQQADLSSDDGQAPPLNHFSKDLVKNTLKLWSGDNVPAFLVGAGIAGASASLDDRVANFFQDESRWDGFDSFGRQLGKSYLLGPAIGVAFFTSRHTGNVKFQRFTYELAQGFVITNAVTGSIKVAAQRERPDATDQLSFPSGHTSNSFVIATVMSRHYGWKVGAPMYVLASYVGASRLKSRKHNLSDIVAGATLGYIVGRTVTRGDQRKRRVSWSVGVPPGGGAALNLGIRIRRP